MTAAAVVAEIRAAGFDLFARDGKLRIRPGIDALPPGLRHPLISGKAEILALLQACGSDVEEVAGTLAAGLGVSAEDFEALCRKVLGRPAPRTRDEDERLRAEILARLSLRPARAGRGVPIAPYGCRDPFLRGRVERLVLDAERVLGPGEPGLKRIVRETVGPDGDLGDLVTLDVVNVEAALGEVEHAIKNRSREGERSR